MSPKALPAIFHPPSEQTMPFVPHSLSLSQYTLALIYVFIGYNSTCLHCILQCQQLRRQQLLLPLNFTARAETALPVALSAGYHWDTYGGPPEAVWRSSKV